MDTWRRFGRGVGTALILILVFAAFSFAQTNFGRLAGTVFDTSGGVLPGANVTITNEATNQTQTVVTNERGAFLFPQLSVGTYKVAIELQGFKTATYPGVAINVGQEYSITARLEIGQLTETVVVEGGTPLVQTTTPEVSKTVSQAQVLQLPLLNRDMTNLIRLSSGVIGNLNAARMNTGINGGKPSWTQVTQDGINVQDNFIRTNSVDFLPNRPTSDNVAEFSITTSVSGADSAGGASSVRMVTPSGSNTFRGSVFTTRRDSDLASRTYFDQKAGNAKPMLKRNQPGGRLGGPVLKNKLFFFGYYEGWRQTTAGAQNVTIPANPDTLKGVFRYVGTDGQLHSVDLLQATGMSADPKMWSDVLSKIADATNVNNTDRGDSKPGRLLNTAGYRFNQLDINSRNYFGGRLDFEASASHHFEGVLTYFKEDDDRPDLDFYSGAGQRPYTYTTAPVKRFVGAWRWLITPRLQNEVRGGANLAPVRFESKYQSGAYRYAGQTGTLPLTLQDPEVNFLPQGRYTNTYQFNDNASFLMGDHALQFGGSLQRIHVNPYNYEGTIPTIGWGFSAAAPASTTLKASMFPGGISSADMSTAQTLLGLVSGTISSVAQTFQVQNQTSGYVPGYYSNRNFTLNNIAAYAQDSWRVKPNLTVRYGLKWEFYSPLREDNNLGFFPVLNGGNFQDVLMDPAATVSFVNGGLYNADRNNFGPTIGFAWDVFKDGRTSIRGGYSLTFVNEETVTVGQNFMNQNAGMSTGVTLSSQYTTLGAGVPVPAVPAFKTTRTTADQMALSATGSIGMIDPNITQPRVHQVSVGIQRELPWSMGVEARYVGTFGRDIWKGVDYNQIKVPQVFADDFQKARSNGYLALAAKGTFNPAYDSTVTGSVPLAVLTNYGGGSLTNSTVRTYIQQNEVASLADWYVSQARLSSALAAFYPNPGIYQVGAMINDGWQNYNALQVELQRRYRNGFMANFSYTWAHTRSNGGGNGQNRFEPYLDNNRKNLDEGRSYWNVNHNLKANLIVDFPFGAGRHWLNNKGRVVNGIVGGWQASSIINWQSGAPLGIYSSRGTFNRANRSGFNTATTSLTPENIQGMMGVYYMPDGRIFYINPSTIGPDGRAVGADNLNNTGFTGQLFSNPTAGGVGNLPILAFDAPASLQVDAALSKRFRILNKYSIEFRGEAFNLFNGVYFFAGDMAINSTTFGRITSVAVPSRVVQITARFEF
jgi:hypothetical protein